MSIYASRRIGTYAVGLDVECSIEMCLGASSATVRATSCEEARQGVMRVLRYRGWQLGKHAAVLCPKHAPPPIVCVQCCEPHPPFYVGRVGEIPFREEAVPDLAEFPASAPLCHGCRGRARRLVFAWHREDRS